MEPGMHRVASSDPASFVAHTKSTARGLPGCAQQFAIIQRMLLAMLLGIYSFTMQGQLQAQHMATFESGFQVEGEAMHAPEIFGAGVGQIRAVNDKVRRYWFHSKLLNVDEVTVAPTLPQEVFDIPQAQIQVSSSEEPRGIHIITAGPFNEFGRRICTITTGKNPKPRIVHQGITVLTPKYFIVQCLGEKGAASLTWEMRFSTSTLSRSILSQLLRHQVKNEKDLDGRLRIVAFYRQAERYREAMIELRAIFREFPEQADLRKKQIQALSKAQSDFRLRQIKQLMDVGQYKNAQRMVSYFKDRKIDDETLVELSDIQADQKKHEADCQTIFDTLDKFIAKLKKDEKLLGESATKVDALVATMKKDLNRANKSRLTDFFVYKDDPTQLEDEKVALAITGWLMGRGAGKQNFSTALSLISVRNLVVEYLKADNHVAREAILRKMESMEGASVANIEKIVGNILPYGDLAEAVELGPGCYRIKVPSLTPEEFYEYEVQLPPEYDPYRRYPCVVSLCGQGSTPSVQIDWWAGDAPKNQTHRAGYAGYNGFIVIAPMWKKNNQEFYKYSAHEHAAVLRSLLDAKKKFSIDSDRVFISGHSMGGDAAWDIGISHPSLWAGIIPIAASNKKYIKFYSGNVRGTVPIYFVHGEHDFAAEEANLPEWKDYMISARNDVVVCQFIGRVHEHFYEEIENLFRWMKVHRRKKAPDEFKCNTYRPWDNFFWWVEVNDVERKNTILPEEWFGAKPETPDGKNKPAAVIDTGFTKNAATGNYSIKLRCPASNATLWFSAETFDMTKRFKVNGQSITVEPSVQTLLEDVRLRRDRQHPFRARVDLFRKSSAWRQIDPTKP